MALAARNVTLTEAAALTGVSRVTIRRYLDKGLFPNAFRTEDGSHRKLPWRLPITDLLAAGLTIQDKKPGPSAREVAPDLADLKAQLAAERAVSTERAKFIEALQEHLRDLNRTLRQLAGEPPPVSDR